MHLFDLLQMIYYCSFIVTIKTSFLQTGHWILMRLVFRTPVNNADSLLVLQMQTETFLWAQSLSCFHSSLVINMYAHPPTHPHSLFSLHLCYSGSWRVLLLHEPLSGIQDALVQVQPPLHTQLYTYTHLIHNLEASLGPFIILKASTDTKRHT